MITNIMFATWFKVPHQEDIVQDSPGVRPADTMADALFLFVFVSVMWETRERLTTAGLEGRVPWHPAMHGSIHEVQETLTGPLEVSDSVCIDGLALLLPVPSADSVIPHLSLAAGTLVDCCLRRGLHLSLSNNKTQAMLAVRGSSGGRAPDRR